MGGYLVKPFSAYDKNIAEALIGSASKLAAVCRDAERYRWRKENIAVEVECFGGRYRCVTRDSVLTDWLDSYDSAIDTAMKDAGGKVIR